MIVRFNTPPLNSSIFTFAPVLPEDVQVIVLVVPLCQISPPLGETTVIDGVEELIVKLFLLVAVYVDVPEPVILIL